MIISEKQIMKLINIAKNYSSLFRLRKNEISTTYAERIEDLVNEITKQQSDELREVK